MQWRAAEAGLGAIFLGGTQHRFSRQSPLVPIELDLEIFDSTYLVMAKTMLGVPRVRVVLERLLAELEAVQDAQVHVNLPTYRG